MLMSPNKHVIYIGVTGNLKKRVWEHRNDLVEGFTKRYKVHNLVYYEMFNTIINAIEREKQLKAGSRKKKLELIRKMNPHFKDLFDEI